MQKFLNPKKKIYLDCAASALPNPSSIHDLGVLAKTKLENARKNVARALNARSSEIIFTSGGTESNNLAIQGIVLHFFEKSKILPHIITTNIEHASVLETFKLLEKRKLVRVSIVPVEKSGLVDPRKIKKAICNETILISVMYANNEIGTIQPIKEIAKEIRHYCKTNGRKNIFFHSDATQAVQYLDLNVESLGVDLLTFSGSKIKNALGVGVLYKRKNVPLVNIFGGGNQEMGLRPGTENLPAILKFASSFALAQKNKNKEVKRLTQLRDYFLQLLSRSNLDRKIIINGDLENRLPNNINISIPNIPSDLLVIELSACGVMASAQSACRSGDGKVSHVIKAINPKIKGADGSLRFSLCQETIEADIKYAVQSLVGVLQKLKKWYH